MTRALVLVLVVGCGASSTSAGGTVGPSDPSLEVDPQECEVDADCMIGTPRNCCTAWCPTDRQAWSVARWSEYQDDCAIAECPYSEEPACRPEDPSPAVAVCVDRRCRLSFP